MLITNNRRLLRVSRHLELDLVEALSLGAAAKIAGLERTHFCRWFRKTTGIRFSEWVTKFRLEKAKGLLLESDLAIKEIVSAVGYKNISTLERHFRKYETMTPTQFRKAATVRPPPPKNTTAADRITTNAETRAGRRVSS